MLLLNMSRADECLYWAVVIEQMSRFSVSSGLKLVYGFLRFQKTLSQFIDATIDFSYLTIFHYILASNMFK